MADQNSNRVNQQHRLDPELLKKGLRCDLDQYEMLKCCSDKKDMTEWNEWRKENPDKDVFLEGADLQGAHLEGANLERAHLESGDLFYARLKGGYLSYAHLEGANLWSTHLEGTNFWGAHLQHANLRDAYLESSLLEEANLEGACLECAHLQGANLTNAHLEDTELWAAHFEKAELLYTHLEDAKLGMAHLEGARLYGAHMQSAYLYSAHLEDAVLERAIVDGSTSLWECKVNRRTDFRSVGLDYVRIDQGTKQLLEYNIRRMNWEEWYKEHRFLKWLVKPFWWMSDYGRSTGRIIFTFFGLAVIFAFVYWLWPSCIVVNGQVGNIRGWWYALYFSIVTPFGVGDIAANPDSPLGQTLLMIQVILGYVLLGALVTRFAVLFTAGGPAGKFADEQSISDRLRQLWARMRGKNTKRP